MITDFQDGDILTKKEADTISQVVDSLSWIVSFCQEHPEWFGGDDPADGAENEWLKNATKLLEET
jgi:hypothetical protein